MLRRVQRSIIVAILQVIKKKKKICPELGRFTGGGMAPIFAILALSYIRLIVYSKTYIR